MNHALHSFRKIWKSLLGNKIYLLIFAIAFALLIFGIAILMQNNNEKEPTTLSADDLQSSIDARNALKDPNLSSVCKNFSKDFVSKIVGENIEKHFPSITDTATAEGSVSGCSYRIEESDNQQFRSVQILKRTLNDQAAAQKSYETITKNKNNIEVNEGEATLLSANNQLVYLNENSITTITISKKNESTNSEEILKKFTQNL